MHQIRADGNCLYYALEYSLGEKDLRQRLSRFILENKQKYLEQIQITHQDFDEYIQKQSSTEWGDELEIYLASEML